MFFLMVPRAPIITGTVVVLSPNICANLDFQVLYLLSFSVVLTEVLVSRGYSHFNEKAGFFLLVL